MTSRPEKHQRLVSQLKQLANSGGISSIADLADSGRLDEFDTLVEIASTIVPENRGTPSVIAEALKVAASGISDANVRVDVAVSWSTLAWKIYDLNQDYIHYPGSKRYQGILDTVFLPLKMSGKTNERRRWAILHELRGLLADKLLELVKASEIPPATPTRITTVADFVRVRRSIGEFDTDKLCRQALDDHASDVESPRVPLLTRPGWILPAPVPVDEVHLAFATPSGVTLEPARKKLRELGY